MTDKWENHNACARRSEHDYAYYSCGITVKRGVYEGGVYAEHIRLAEGGGIDCAECGGTEMSERDGKCGPCGSCTGRFCNHCDGMTDHYTSGHPLADVADLADERADILARFTAELAKATGDGSKKRRAGTKPPWHQDDSHEAAMFSHLMKWKRGDVIDPDSGAHTLVHLAWRALAIALRESGNVPEAGL